MANSLISMIKGDSTLIDNTEVLDGQVLFDTTNQKILLDSGTERREYGGSADNALKKVNVAYIEPTMVTTRGYSAGTYIMVQDTLYKTTTQVNSGTTLVVGTNVSVVTVGGELTQINNDLSVFSFRNNNGTAQYSMDDGSTWTNFKNPVGTRYIYSNGTYDVTNYASAYVSVSASFSETTLWENPSPVNIATHSYTLSQSIDNFKYIKIECQVSTSNTTKCNAIFDPDYLKTTGSFSTAVTTGAAVSCNLSGQYRWRIVQATDNTTIKISTGYYIVGSTGSGGNSNSLLIPTKITGLR